ncbi:MAG: hypothetical protein CL476_13500 [Acidobacteria bacterium]|nr:hypothetical protein [Acidobacteriota bacterium]
MRDGGGGRAVPDADDPGAPVILEVGSQRPWLSRALTAAGCDVIVANARRVRLIAEHDAKSDRLDAELLPGWAGWPRCWPSSSI